MGKYILDTNCVIKDIDKLKKETYYCVFIIEQNKPFDPHGECPFLAKSIKEAIEFVNQNIDEHQPKKQYDYYIKLMNFIVV